MDESRTPSDTTDQKKSKKPANSKFKQQRLPAWQPVLTAKTVIPTFFLLGVVFIPVGAVLYTTSQGVKEHVIDYTSDPACKHCIDTLNTTAAHEDGHESCKCNISFTLETAFEKPVYMYYGLDNFYQNHRRYVKSRDDTQLLGEIRTIDDISTDCKPYRTRVENNVERVIAPCGAIANSLFNDSLSLEFNGVKVPLLKKGIAWVTDKEAKFKNPTDSKELCDSAALKNTVKPPNWTKKLCQLDNDTDNNGFINEDLIVWMRNAALPNFRKLYRRVDHTDKFKDSLPKGDYNLIVEYNYPVKDFGGSKKMILSTVSWLGGKNPFLGIAYMAVGVICVVLAICFVAVHLRMGKSDMEVTEVNNRTPYM